MKRYLLLTGLITLPFLGNAQIFQEDFDGNGPGFEAWKTINNDDGIPNYTFMKGNEAWIKHAADGVREFFRKPDGDNFALSTSLFTNRPLTADRWLISPQITISGSKPTLYFDAKSYLYGWADDYKVLISVNGGDEIADFRTELFSLKSEIGDWNHHDVDLTPYIGKTVRIAFVNNSEEGNMLMIDNIKIDEYAPYYCLQPYFYRELRPMTHLEFANIDQAIALEDNTTTRLSFVGDDSLVPVLERGKTYQMKVQGYTGTWGDANSVYAYFDWNQNYLLKDRFEQFLGVGNNRTPDEDRPNVWIDSDGKDGKAGILEIKVPSDAKLGNTRMRLKISTTGVFTNLDDPCSSGDKHDWEGDIGQTIDYTVKVVEGTLGTDEASAQDELKVYPNPVVNTATISYSGKVNAIHVYDISGKLVKSTGSTKEVNLSSLQSGIYLMQIDTDAGKKTVKVVKK